MSVHIGTNSSAEPNKLKDGGNSYSIQSEAEKVFRNGILLNPLISKDLPKESIASSALISFTGSPVPSIPINWRFAESISALKAYEATLINILLKRKYGVEPQAVTINTDHASLFIMSTLLCTLDPGGENIPMALMTKVPKVDKYFPSYDIYRSNAPSHRSAATNIYKCADGRYFHLHGSLNPSPSIAMVGLEEDREASTYEEAVQPYLKAVSKIPSDKLQVLASDEFKQAGTIAYSVDEYASSEHGKANAHVGLFEIHDRPNLTQKPGWWPPSPESSPLHPLAGLKVVDLTRIIAAPAVTRGLAELGASVMRVTAPHLPDYGSLHVDLNWGKWESSIDLRQETGREKLRALILDADVVVQGYRPGVMEKYGFSQDDIIKICAGRERGIISVRENCYGWNGPWSYRSGWQQISDACTGVSLSFGQAMGVDEPVTPVFPNSDYCTGIAGVTGILTALLRRGEVGGSYAIDIALNYYNQWLTRSVGTYPDTVFEKVRAETGHQKFRHYHGMGWTIPNVLASIRQGIGAKRIFKDEFFHNLDAEVPLGKGKKIRVVKPVLEFPDGKVKPGYQVCTRTNGVDAPRWPEDLSVQVVT